MNDHLLFLEKEQEKEREESQRENLIYLLKSFVFNENRIV